MLIRSARFGAGPILVFDAMIFPVVASAGF